MTEGVKTTPYLVANGNDLPGWLGKRSDEGVKTRLYLFAMVMTYLADSVWEVTGM